MGEGLKYLMTDFIQRARDLRKNSTEAEKLLWSKLRNNQFLNIKFRRQHPYPPYMIDFYNEDHKIAIELDGGQHNDSEQQNYDKARTQFLEKGGVRVVRFWNNDVLNNIEGALEELKKYFPSEVTSPPQDLSPSPLPSPVGRGSHRRILIGEISTAHGIKGYVKVRSFVENEKLFESPSLFTDEISNKTITLKLKNAIKNDWIAKVIGVDDRNAAELLRGTQLYLNRNDLPDIDDGEFYIEDLKGMKVVNSDNQEIGIIVTVENFGAGDLMDIKPPNGPSFYIPFTDDTVINVDMDNGVITIDMPEVL